MFIFNGKTPTKKNKKTWIWLISETSFKYFGDNYYYYGWHRANKLYYILIFWFWFSNSFRRMNHLRHLILIWYYCYWLLKYFSFWLLFNFRFILFLFLDVFVSDVKTDSDWMLDVTGIRFWYFINSKLVWFAEEAVRLAFSPFIDLWI